jgi:hypothetical protein
MSEEDRSLDPPDWERLRAVGHEMVDVLLDWLRDIRQQPA